MGYILNAAGRNKTLLAQYDSLCIRDSKNNIFGKRIGIIKDQVKERKKKSKGGCLSITNVVTFQGRLHFAWKRTLHKYQVFMWPQDY